MADEPKTTEQAPAEPEAPASAEQALEQGLRGELRAQFGEAVLETAEFRDQPWAVVEAASLVEVCRWLRDERGFRYLADVIAADYPKKGKRFEVVYQLFCHERAERFRLKVRLAEGEAVPSVTPVWSGAGWPERECFDLMGVSFAGHPDLRRILLPEEAEGHPLRKDYPVRGRNDLGFKVER
jgi:NADH-quinone oxidoreductase subunit C